MKSSTGKTFYALCVALLSFSLTGFYVFADNAAENSGADSISLKLITEFVVKGSIIGDTDNRIDTVQDQAAKSREFFRVPPSSGNRGPKRIPPELIYVQPGGLEPAVDTNDYEFAFDEKLKIRYRKSSFAFSGWASSLVFIYRFGWGTENSNGNFMPYLIESTYEKIDQPAYEFVWSDDNVPDGARWTPYGTIGLNYVFKVPKNTHTKWGNELSFSRFTMAGSFTANAPGVKSNSIFRWRNGIFQVFGGNLKRPSTLRNWKLPFEYQLSAFAVPSAQDVIYTTNVRGYVNAIDSSGRKIWETGGRAPVILLDENHLVTVTADYRSLQIIETKTGMINGTCALPRFLPKEDNSLALVDSDEGKYLFFQIPRQNKILCIKVSVTPPEKTEAKKGEKASPALKGL